MHCINILRMTLYLLLPPSDIHVNYTHNYLYSHTIVQRKWGLTLLNQVNWEWQAACVYGAVVQNGYGTGIRVELLICMCTDRALATARTAVSPGSPVIAVLGIGGRSFTHPPVPSLFSFFYCPLSISSRCDRVRELVTVNSCFKCGRWWKGLLSTISLEDKV